MVIGRKRRSLLSQQVTQVAKKQKLPKIKLEKDTEPFAQTNRRFNHNQTVSESKEYVQTFIKQEYQNESDSDSDLENSSEEEYKLPRSRTTRSNSRGNATRRHPAVIGSEVKSRSTRKRINTCVECEYVCARKNDLTRHMRTHTGVKPFQCNECEYACARKSGLTRHMYTHTGVKPFQCNECEYACATKSGLTRHIRTHIY